MDSFSMNKTKQVSIMAISAALFTVFFFLSYALAIPGFVLIYFPIILLGVFPLWFGLPGLAGSMIGAFIGGVFVEGLGFLAWAEAVDVLIIYGLNWVLIPKMATELKTKKNLFVLSGIYALTLFVGTSYILWQLTNLGILEASVAEITLLPVFALNIVIQLVACPALIRTLSPKLRNWGIYSGTFNEWRRRRAKTKS
jgi:hypothetical protein